MFKASACTNKCDYYYSLKVAVFFLVQNGLTATERRLFGYYIWLFEFGGPSAALQ